MRQTGEEHVLAEGQTILSNDERLSEGVKVKKTTDTRHQRLSKSVRFHILTIVDFEDLVPSAEPLLHSRLHCARWCFELYV